MNSLKKHIKLVIGIVIGMSLPWVVFAATILYSGDQVSYDNSVTGFESTDVQGALDELYLLCSPESNGAKGVRSSIKRLSVGDYFTMVTDNDIYKIEEKETGYSEKQEIKPNELTLWRVIKINDDRTIDAVSEYVSSDKVYFKGITGYANFVGGLQEIAKAYEKKDYTSEVRIMGYNNQTLTIENESSFDGSTPSDLFEASDLTTGTGVEVGNGEFGDTLYLKDYLLVSDLYKEDKNEKEYCESGLCAYKVGTEKKTQYWLASRGRDISTDPKIAYYTGRSIDDNGDLKHNDLLRGYNLSNHDWSNYSSFNALRPIITLYKEVTIKDGEGSKKNPYILK